MSSSRLRSHLLVLAAVCLSLFVAQPAAAQRLPAVPHKAPVTEFVVQGDQFLVKRSGDTELRREFLVFISYFDALRAAEPGGSLAADLKYIADHGFTGVRVFGTWHDMSETPGDNCIVPYGPRNLFKAEHEGGHIRGDRLALLLNVIDVANANGLIVDLSFDHGTVGDTTAFTIEEYKNALTSLAYTLRGRRNVLFDLQNEYDLGGPTHLEYADVKAIYESVKSEAGDPNRIVTASTTLPTELTYSGGPAKAAYDAGLDVIAHHEQRGDDWAAATRTVVQGLRVVPSGQTPKPVYLQEPRPYQHSAALCGKSNQSDTSAARADNQRNALKNAKEEGAAAWLFHLEHAFVLEETSFEANVNAEPGLRDLIEGVGAVQKLALQAGDVSPPNPTEISLVVGLEGDGTGRITGTGIDCTGTGPDCLQTYSTTGTTVTLTAAADTGVNFGGWTVNGAAACAGLNACAVTVNGYTRVRALFTLVREETVQYFHHDAIGSVRQVTSAAGGTVSIINFRPFGEEGFSEDALDVPRKFTGMERDAEIDADYFGARYYLPLHGRFTTVDPLMTIGENLLDPQRWNRYVYARDNPFRYVDPDGRGVAGKVIKLIAKGGDVYATVSGVIEDVNTLTDSNASKWDRFVAAASLASELLPVSGRDVKEGFEFAAGVVSQVSQVSQVSKGARRLPFKNPDILQEANRTLDDIDTSGPFRFLKDGTKFKNQEGRLPIHGPDYYKEYTVETPGLSHRGPRRIVVGDGGEYYYTDDHYRTFVRFDPRSFPF